MPKIEPIRTERLIIREFAQSDRDSLLDFVKDPGQIRYMMLFLDTEEELDAFLAEAIKAIDSEPRKEWHFAVESPGDGRYLGSVCLMAEKDSPSSAELGYWFLRDAWGRGYATEASAAMLELGFGALRLHRVWGKCDDLNASSARVMEKLNMRFEGTLREHVWLRDHYRSSRLYGILENEYRAAR